MKSASSLKLSLHRGEIEIFLSFGFSNEEYSEGRVATCDTLISSASDVCVCVFCSVAVERREISLEILSDIFASATLATCTVCVSIYD